MQEPQSIFVWGEDGCCYLGGDGKNDAFNRDLKRVFVNEVVPEAVSRNLSSEIATCNLAFFILSSSL